MSTSRILGLTILAVGIVVFGFGINASHTPGERLYEGVTGHFTDRTNGLIIGGGVAMLIGVVMAILGRRRAAD